MLKRLHIQNSKHVMPEELQSSLDSVLKLTLYLPSRDSVSPALHGRKL
jgi:hypothetical protein